MLKKIVNTLVLLTVLVMVAVPMLAQDEQTVTTDSPVVVRSGPGLNYMPIGGIPADGKLTVTGRNAFDANRVCVTPFSATSDMWLRVDLQGVEGWVARCAVTYTGQVSSLTVADPINPIEDYVGPYNCNCDVYPEYSLGATPNEAHAIGYTRYPRLFVHDNPALTSDSDLVEIESMYIIGRSADGYWVQVQFDLAFQSVEGADLNPTTQTGWVARYLMLLPNDWQESVPVK